MAFNKAGTLKKRPIKSCYGWAHTPVDCLFSSCAFMFQGPAGTKGDKGERVSHSTVLPLFRANQVLLVHFAVEKWLFCWSKTLNNYSLMPHALVLKKFQQSAAHSHCFLFVFRTSIRSASLAFPQPRLRRTKSNQCSWSKFAAVQGLHFCWHRREAATAEGFRDTQLASLNWTCNSCFCFILATVGDICTLLQLISVQGSTWKTQGEKNTWLDFSPYVGVRWPHCDGSKGLVFDLCVPF